MSTFSSSIHAVSGASTFRQQLKCPTAQLSLLAPLTDGQISCEWRGRWTYLHTASCNRNPDKRRERGTRSYLLNRAGGWRAPALHRQATRGCIEPLQPQSYRARILLGCAEAARSPNPAVKSSIDLFCAASPCVPRKVAGSSQRSRQSVAKNNTVYHKLSPGRNVDHWSRTRARNARFKGVSSQITYQVHITARQTMSLVASGRLASSLPV